MSNGSMKSVTRPNSTARRKAHREKMLDRGWYPLGFSDKEWRDAVKQHVKVLVGPQLSTLTEEDCLWAPVWVTILFYKSAPRHLPKFLLALDLLKDNEKRRRTMLVSFAIQVQGGQPLFPHEFFRAIRGALGGTS